MANIIDIEESRYSRLELINWWRQDILRRAKIFVAGCGALGNEIIKNLAMLGCGNIFTADMDKVEKSNLSRSVLFRYEDEGKFKSETCCRRAKEINNEINLYFYNGNIFNLGLGVFRDMDLVICGLDNRETRLYLNQVCYKISKPMIDGAIESLKGIARMFVPPETACYECTMNEVDYKLLNKRKSCLLLGIEEIASGKIPTTPTISSVIAGVQVQEAVKYLHGKDELQLLKGKGFVFNGYNNDSYIVEYQKNENCYSHYTFENIISCDKNFDEITFGDIFKFGKQYFGNNGFSVQFNNEIVYSLKDEDTGYTEDVMLNLNLISVKDVKKNNKLLKPLVFNNLAENSDLPDKFEQLKIMNSGVPFNDLITVKSKKIEINLEFKNIKVFNKI